MSDAPFVSTGGLDRLLEDLVRDGWLMGMNAGLDPAMARMDPATGVFRAEHFRSLVEVAINDRERGRQRLGDGPATGNVAVLSVRIVDWPAFAKQGPTRADQVALRIARALEGVLRPDDVLGRTAEDTFSLLLRGCPMVTLEAIAHRCVAIMKATEVDLGGHMVPVKAQSCVVAWGDHTADELIDASTAGLARVVKH